MILFLSLLTLSVIGANASGELSIIHSPDSLTFSGSSKFSENTLKEIYSAALGLSVDQNTEWSGLTITDPFSTPEALVEVFIDGVSSLGEDLNHIKSYQFSINENEHETYDAVTHRIRQRFISGQNNLVNLNLNDLDEIKKWKGFEDIIVNKEVTSGEYLSPDVPEDKAFLDELEILDAVAEEVLSGAIEPDNVVDYIKFQVTSIHPLSDTHGPNSPQLKEAKKILGESLSRLNNAFVKAYGGNVLVTVVTMHPPHTRVRRSTDSVEQQQQRANLYQSGDGKDYAAIFNIILWFGVVFTFSLVAIVYAIMDMDPGRDSIIYRMTSTRMKKEN